VLYLILEKLLPIFDCFVESMFDLGIEIDWKPIMIFELVGCILNHLLRIPYYLV
jgi:hypothetical protein